MKVPAFYAYPYDKLQEADFCIRFEGERFVYHCKRSNGNWKRIRTARALLIRGTYGESSSKPEVGKDPSRVMPAVKIPWPFGIIWRWHVGRVNVLLKALTPQEAFGDRPLTPTEHRQKPLKSCSSSSRQPPFVVSMMRDQVAQDAIFARPSN